ncbi:DNA double-strand break repair ATPase Rad50 [Venenivibrio stagnispumantis]|uniref:Exonuclease SbcC n=1 Tax=Venenivibrio stagnispumantis TaxID=407998 RepID=A0AA45WIF5_9AQUI|nr:AAA family ATPase [Venenivibrio stagnispumantis]SMP00372.1 exonuclease SbcC [Venenivibrio stagnispumantis]
MRLKGIVLNNFLIHDNTEIEFADNGITAFIGNNGAGKSSIVEAVSFALFGKSDKGNLIDLIKWGRNRAVVKLYFTKDNKDFVIKREITATRGRANTTSLVYQLRGEQEIPYIQKNIDKELPKLTGLTLKTFINSVLVKQGDIEGLIKLTPSKRKEVLEELLDLKVFQLLSEKYAEKRREKERLIKDIEVRIQDLDNLIANMEKLLSEKEEKEAEKSKVEEEKRKIENHKKEILQILNNLRKEKEEIIQLKNRIETINIKIENNKKRLKEIEEFIKNVENEEKKLPELTQAVKELKEKEEILSLYQEVKKLEIERKNLEEKYNKAKENEEFIKKFEKIAKEYEEKEKQKKELEQHLSQINKKEGELRQLQSEINQKEKQLKEQRDKVINVAKILSSKKQIYKMLEQNPEVRNEMIKNNQDKINQLRKQLEELTAEKGAVESQIKILKKQLENINNLKGSCPTCLRPLDQHSKEEVIKDLNLQLQQKTAEYKEISDKLKQITQQIDFEEEIRKLLEEYKNQYEIYKTIYKELNEKKAKFEVAKREISKKEEIENQIKEIEIFLQNQKDDYSKYKTILRENLNIQTLQKQLNDLRAKIDKIYSQIGKVEENKLKQEIQNLKEKEREFIKVKNLIEQKKEQEKLSLKIKEEIKNLQEELEKIDLSNKRDENLIQQDINSKELQLSQIEQNLTYLNNKLSGLMAQIGELSGYINALEKQIEEIKDLNNKMENLKISVKKYEEVENALFELQKNIRNRALYELPKVVSHLFFFKDYFSKITFDEDFDIILYPETLERQERKISVEALSGGQRVALSLALRLAIARYLGSKANFLILDEPTIHLDTERRQELVDLLGSIKEKNFIKQLIVVTHDQEIEDRADIVYRVENGSVKPL